MSDTEQLEQGAVEGGDTVEVSIDDTLRDTYATIMADEAEGAEPSPAAAGETEPAKPAAPGRDASGRFAKAEGATDPVGQPAAPAQAAGDFTDKGPPATWRAAAKAHWDNLTPELKAEVYKRENDVMQGIGQYQAKAQVADSLMQAIQPYRPIMDTLGADVPTALGEVLKTAATLYVGTPAQKLATLRSLAQQHGVDLGQAVNNGQPDRFADPVVDALRQELQELRGNLSQRDARERAVAQQSQQAQVQQAWGEIVAFGNDAKNRYFADVKQQMGALISAGAADSLQDAYEKACKLNPQVAAAIEAENAAAKAKADAEERAKRAKEARRAGSLAVRSSVPAAPLQPAESMEDTMRRTYRELTANG